MASCFFELLCCCVLVAFFVLKLLNCISCKVNFCVSRQYEEKQLKAVQEKQEKRLEFTKQQSRLQNQVSRLLLFLTSKCSADLHLGLCPLSRIILTPKIHSLFVRACIVPAVQMHFSLVRSWTTFSQETTLHKLRNSKNRSLLKKKK